MACRLSDASIWDHERVVQELGSAPHGDMWLSPQSLTARLDLEYSEKKKVKNE